MAIFFKGYPMPVKSKGIVIEGGQDAPLLCYAKGFTYNKLSNAQPIIFDEGKYEAKSITAEDLLKYYDKTGQMPISSLSKVDVKVGDLVQSSYEGIEEMGLNYWMRGMIHNTFVVTGFHSSGSVAKCEHGNLPPLKYLTVVGRKFSDSSITMSNWANEMLQVMEREYGVVQNPLDRDVILEKIKNCESSWGSLHGQYIDTSHWEWIIVAESKAIDYINEYFSDQEAEYLGGYNVDFLAETFPEMGRVFEALNESSSQHAIGEIIFGLQDGVQRLSESLVSKYGVQTVLGDNLNWYDNQALKYVRGNEVFYLLRRD